MSSSPTAALSRRPLMEVFAQVPDPRDPRGVRHDLATVRTLAQTAVLAGARTLLAIAEWTQDTARETLTTFPGPYPGSTRRSPAGSARRPAPPSAQASVP